MSTSETTPLANESHVTVDLVRSVRFGRIIVTAIIVGAVAGAVASLLFPVREDIAYVQYTLGQIAGFMAVIGAAAGLLVGGIAALLLGVAAKKRRGQAIAVMTDYDT